MRYIGVDLVSWSPFFPLGFGLYDMPGFSAAIEGFPAIHQPCFCSQSSGENVTGSYCSGIHIPVRQHVFLICVTSSKVWPSRSSHTDEDVHHHRLIRIAHFFAFKLSSHHDIHQ